jgi:streptogramin lyase
MNSLRRVVVSAMVAAAALMTWSSVASAGNYIGRIQPGNHQSNSVPAPHAAVATRAVNTSVSSLAAARAHYASASGSGAAASHANVHLGNAHNTILPH